MRLILRLKTQSGKTAGTFSDCDFDKHRLSVFPKQQKDAETKQETEAIQTLRTGIREGLRVVSDID